MNETVLDQTLAVISEKSNLEMNQLKQQVNLLQNQLQNGKLSSGNAQQDLTPLFMQMMQVNVQQGRQTYTIVPNMSQNVPSFSGIPNSHPFGEQNISMKLALKRNKKTLHSAVRFSHGIEISH